MGRHVALTQEQLLLHMADGWTLRERAMVPGVPATARLTSPDGEKSYGVARATISQLTKQGKLRKRLDQRGGFIWRLRA